MVYTILPIHLHQIADIANQVIKLRYGLSNGIIEQQIDPRVGLQPTLHWKTKKEFIICEVSQSPYPTSIRLLYGEIAATGLPIRIIVAYPQDHSLSGAECTKEQRMAKALGIGYFAVDSQYNTSIEYTGVCVNQRIEPIDLNKYPKILNSSIREAYEAYMANGSPDVGLQKLGQLAENMIFNVAVEAKKKGKFISTTRFNPPRNLPHRLLLEDMITDRILNVGILGRCSDFAKERNNVSHKPKNIKAATKIASEIRDNFITGLKLIKDLPEEIKRNGYKVKP